MHVFVPDPRVCARVRARVFVFVEVLKGVRQNLQVVINCQAYLRLLPLDLMKNTDKRLLQVTNLFKQFIWKILTQIQKLLQRAKLFLQFQF